MIVLLVRGLKVSEGVCCPTAVQRTYLTHRDFKFHWILHCVLWLQVPTAALKGTLCHLLSQACMRNAHTTHRVNTSVASHEFVHANDHMRSTFGTCPSDTGPHYRGQFTSDRSRRRLTVGGRRCCHCHRLMMQRSQPPGLEPL